MGKYWKSPKEEFWTEFIVDGKIIGIAKGAAAEKEKKRLSGLMGIYIGEASPEALIKHRAKTNLPKRIYEKMESEHRSSIRVKR